MFNWLRNKRYKNFKAFSLACIILGIFGQDKEVYPAENINFSYGYSYYFFAKRMTWCVTCFNVVEGRGWLYPDEAIQSVFEAAAESVFAERYSGIKAAACSELCWHQFMEEGK